MNTSLTTSMCNSVYGGPYIDDSLGAGSGELIDAKGAREESINAKLDLDRVADFTEKSL